MSEKKINVTDVRFHIPKNQTSVFFKTQKHKNIIKNYIYDIAKYTIPQISFPEELKL